MPCPRLIPVLFHLPHDPLLIMALHITDHMRILKPAVTKVDPGKIRLPVIVIPHGRFRVVVIVIPPKHHPGLLQFTLLLKRRKMLQNHIRCWIHLPNLCVHPLQIRDSLRVGPLKIPSVIHI